MKTMFKNIIFDWSGTLVDDLNLTLDASNYVFAQYGRNALDRDAFREEFQLPYPDYYARVLPEADLEELESHFRKAFDESSASVEVLPHAREFMEFCKEGNIRCFILSSVDASKFEIQCRELGMFHYFEGIHSGIRHKNTYIHQLLEQHSLCGNETAFIGDMQHDILSGKHGGVTSIAVLTGYNSASQLAAVEPDMIVPDLAALKRILIRSSKNNKSPDHISIKGLKLTCHIGVPDEERASPQNLLADITLFTEKSLSGLQDDIANTINYDSLAQSIGKEALRTPRKLIETLAEDIGKLCCRQNGVAKAKIEIKKYILPQTDHVSVTVHHSQNRA